MPSTMTVTGPRDTATLGVVSSHEHVLWDYFQMLPSYAHIHDDEDLAAKELSAFADAGGGAMVECSTVGIRTDVTALRRISERSGVALIAGAGWYRERLYPAVVHESTINQLADVLVSEITQGLDGTDVRAGVIGEIGTERGHISPAEERVFRAAARAARETGVPVLTHTTHFGELAHDQLDILADEGLPPDRVLISHLGDRPSDPELCVLAGRGAYVSVDNIGYRGNGYPGDEVRAENVKALCDAGYSSRVVLGCDISSTDSLRAHGGHGYDWLLTSFVPRLRDLGVDDDELRKLTQTNMADALGSRQ